MEFPNDANGDVLRSIFESGMDLSVPHDIDFVHLFAQETKAVVMRDRVRQMGLQADVEPNDTVGGFDVRVVVRIVPTHANITRTELQLAAIATESGGQADGWGVLQE